MKDDLDLVEHTRAKRILYATNVNMNYSFDTLAEMASQLLRKPLEIGDILICDNHRGDKRKVLQMTKTGFMVYYGRLNDGLEFLPLAENDGVLHKIDSALF